MNMPKNYTKEARQETIKRIQEAKETLRNHRGWRNMLYERYPEYNTASGLNHLENFLRGKATSDSILLSRIEQLAQELKN